MKTWMMIVCMVLLSAAPLAAQQENADDADNALQEPRYVKVGAGGGFITTLGLFKNDEINATLRSVGMPELNSNPMVLIGGEGYGYIMVIPNLRVGGFGTGGSKSVSMLDTAGFHKEVDYHVSYGGLLIDYVVPVVRHLDIAGGFTIGGGAVEVQMSRNNTAPKTWGGLWNEFGSNAPAANVTRSLNGSFVSFNPHLNIEYTLLTWVQLRVGVSYPMLFNPSWQMNDNEDVQNVPDSVKPDGMTVSAGLMLGFFN